MKRLSTLVLLASAVQLLGAAPALEAVTCNLDGGAAAARKAMHFIDEHHDHGYKFRLLEVQDHKVEKVDGGCNMELKLNLGETVCHTVNPKHFEDCEYRGTDSIAVSADCTVMMTVRNGDAAVTKYNCTTEQALSPEEMVMTCPDCPTLIPLTSPEGLMSVNQAIKEFNKNATLQREYILQEVGRLRTGYVMMAGMFFYAEFVLVESHCPKNSRILTAACNPLCPDRANHVLCHSSYSSKKYQISLRECEFYPPKDTTALGPGEQERVCMTSQAAGPPGLPSLPDHPALPDPPSDPYPHGGIPVPPGLIPSRSRRSLGFNRPALDSYHPLSPNHPCHGSDQSLHHICPWPLPDQQQTPRS